MLLKDVGDLILFQALNEFVYFFYVVPFIFTLHQRANSHRFRRKSIKVVRILGLQK